MSEKKVNKKLVDLLNQVVGSVQGCFYTRLEEEGKEFLDACVEVRKSGRKVSAEKIRDVLGRDFKVQASETGIRRHLKEACTCHSQKIETT